MPELWILHMALDTLKLYPHMKFHFNSISWTWVYAFGQKKYENWQRGITPKILMPESWILCMALDPLKLYPHMKFHFNSISWAWDIAMWRNKCDGIKSVTGQKVWKKVWRDKKCDVGQKCDVRTDGRTDGWTDGRTDRQTTQKGSLSVTSAYSRWHKKRWHTSWKFQLEITSNKKAIAKKPLTNLYEMNSIWNVSEEYFMHLINDENKFQRKRKLAWI